MKNLKISVKKIFFRTSFMLKSEHFLSQSFSKESNLGIMYWNLNACKTLHFKTHEKQSFLWNEFVQIFETQILSAMQSYNKLVLIL